jgi:arylsulfatase A-like enzyme
MYDPELNFVDMQLGRIFDHLKATGQDENTIIIITADHGQGLKDGQRRHGWIKHRLLYQWCLRVPLILRIPGEDPAVVKELVRTIDILPTLLEVLDMAAPAPMEGQSLLGLARGEAQGGRIAYAEALNLIDTHAPKRGLPAHCVDNLFCVTDGRWKMIHHEKQPGNTELFDLEADPMELRNIAVAHPEEVQRLRAFLHETGAMQIRAGTAGEEDAGQAALLHSLGYTGDQ